MKWQPKYVNKNGFKIAIKKTIDWYKDKKYQFENLKYIIYSFSIMDCRKIIIGTANFGMKYGLGYKNVNQKEIKNFKFW